jgi:hypothetical protein
MLRVRLVVLGVVSVALAGLAWAGGDGSPQLSTAHGMVEKAEKDSLAIRLRTAEGRFAKGMVLKVSGGSRVTILTLQKRQGKLVPVQREAEVKDLEPKQNVAVIYTTLKSGPVLLSAVAEPAAGK